MFLLINANTPIALTNFHIPSSSEAVVIGIAAILLVVLLVMLLVRRLKKRKTASIGDPNADNPPFGADLGDSYSHSTHPGPPAPADSGPPPLFTSGTASTELDGLGLAQHPPAPPVPVAVPTTPQPGWLPDPSGNPDLIRYWDGAAWTDYTAQRSG